MRQAASKGACLRGVQRGAPHDVQHVRPACGCVEQRLAGGSDCTAVAPGLPQGDGRVVGADEQAVAVSSPAHSCRRRQPSQRHASKARAWYKKAQPSGGVALGVAAAARTECTGVRRVTAAVVRQLPGGPSRRAAPPGVAVHPAPTSHRQAGGRRRPGEGDDVGDRASPRGRALDHVQRRRGAASLETGDSHRACGLVGQHRPVVLQRGKGVQTACRGWARLPVGHPQHPGGWKYTRRLGAAQTPTQCAQHGRGTRRRRLRPRRQVAHP